MKKIAFVLLGVLSLVPAIVAAQSREETESWILEQTKFNLDGRLIHKVEGGNLISELTLPFPPGGGDILKRKIPLASVKTMSYLQTDKFLSFSLMCEDECMHQTEANYAGKFKSERRSKKFLFEIFRTVDKSYGPRMEKALLHLITLNGGKAKVVPHVVQKEAF
jgi:hypothetical protein